jgi:hypothetical protein
MCAAVLGITATLVVYRDGKTIAVQEAVATPG